MSDNAAALLFWSQAATAPASEDDGDFCAAAAFRWAQSLIAEGC